MIRHLVVDDAGAVADLHKQAFESAWSESEMQDHIIKDISLGWDDDGVLAGFIFIRSAADQSEILTLVVSEDNRQTNIGSKLVEAGEEAANVSGADIMFLEVAEDNPAAIALYEKSGYENFGRRPGYYKRQGGRVAAQLFRKNLSASA